MRPVDVLLNGHLLLEPIMPDLREPKFVLKSLTLLVGSFQTSRVASVGVPLHDLMLLQ
jgi:hypothetical protein